MFNFIINKKNISAIFLIFALFATLATNNVSASQTPRFLGSEKKFRSYIYNPNEVYRYIGHYTYQGFIEFDEGESISTISMGNPTLWMFEHLENRLFLKPVGEDNSETNMTIITNKRIYHFELAAKEAKGINDQDLIFVAKFLYPEGEDKNILEFNKSEKSDEPDMSDLSIYNFDYQYVGENSISPLKVFDDQQFTYFQFARKNAEIPAIFTVDSSGFESLVNFRSVGDYIVVEQMAPQFTLRSGQDIVCVYNSRLYSTKNSTSNSNDHNKHNSTRQLNQSYNVKSVNNKNKNIALQKNQGRAPIIDNNMTMKNPSPALIQNESQANNKMMMLPN